MLTKIDSDTTVCYDTETEIITTDHLPGNTGIASYSIHPGQFAANDESEIIMMLTQNNPFHDNHKVWNFTKNILEDVEKTGFYNRKVANLFVNL